MAMKIILIIENKKNTNIYKIKKMLIKINF